MHAKTVVGKFIVVCMCLTGCKDRGKESATKASVDVGVLETQVDKDIAEIKNGLPEGAKKLSASWEPKMDPTAAKKVMTEVQRSVPDLNVAKSTFFAVADENGVAIRNNLEEDVMAGLNLVQIFPELAKAKDGYVETQGSFPGVVGKNGPDKDWIAAAPIQKDGKTAGLYVTGWTYRYFARHLQEYLKSKMAADLRASGDTGKMPIYYIGVYDKSGVYMAPLTPPVNEKALADEDLVSKTASGSAQGTLNITDRAFGWAAKRIPKLGAETGIVELRSEL